MDAQKPARSRDTNRAQEPCTERPRGRSHGFLKNNGKTITLRIDVHASLFFTPFLFFSLLFFLPNWEVTDVHSIKRFWLLVKQKLTIFDQFVLITDIRKKPEIKLNAIIMSILLMPFYSMKSLLGLDRLSRKISFKRLFNCKRKMVASDSTISRSLSWMNPDEVTELQESLLPVFRGERLQRIQIDKDTGYRTIGIIDGSCMGNHYLSAFVLSGKTEYPLVIENCKKRGKELPVSKVLLDKAYKLLRSDFPHLILVDALYFNENSFHRVRRKKSHILIKCKDPNFRDVLKNAQFILNAKNEVADKVTTANGFDSARMCQWTIEITSGDFAGYPINIAHLIEDYPLQKEDKSHVESWIVTTDLSLTPNEIREIAHLRWHIENDVFKRLSHLAGTKTFYFRDPKPFFNLIRLLCLALAVYDILIYSLRSSPNFFNKIRDGIKPTWKNIFSQLDDWLFDGIFDLPQKVI